ncbi:L,D-transpeptidase [Pelagibacterium sp.]|uniref:L,D-transpeptidase n=1 Tax=Pelagibacterium sp. TaxID=1967288 RepID=UPI003A911E98
MNITRRFVLTGLGTIAVTPVLGPMAQDNLFDIAGLAPGDFTWHPERQPSGPVSVIVSIPQQLVHVYRNGVRIGVSTCSTGREGHRTPRGVFVVLQKDKDHHSSTYNNAPMPNMNRLTWSGIALHAGDLPGYPASHGCVRLPLEFSERLFTVTHLGTPVIIADDHGDPWELTHPGLILAPNAEANLEAAENALDAKSRAEDWIETAPHPVLSIIASSADRTIMLIEDGIVRMQSTLEVSGDHRLGSNVLMLQGTSQGAMKWVAVAHDQGEWDSQQRDDQVLARLVTQDDFREAMVRAMHPGMTFVTTDLPLHPDTRTGADFVIMA